MALFLLHEESKASSEMLELVCEAEKKEIPLDFMSSVKATLCSSTISDHTGAAYNQNVHL